MKTWEKYVKNLEVKLVEYKDTRSSVRTQAQSRLEANKEQFIQAQSSQIQRETGVSRFDKVINWQFLHKFLHVEETGL